jgi:hypothetical protein
LCGPVAQLIPLAQQFNLWRRGNSRKGMQAKLSPLTSLIPGKAGHVLLPNVLGIVFRLTFNFQDVSANPIESIHPLDVAICRIKTSIILVNTITSTTRQEL